MTSSTWWQAATLKQVGFFGSKLVTGLVEWAGPAGSPWVVRQLTVTPLDSSSGISVEELKELAIRLTAIPSYQALRTKVEEAIERLEFVEAEDATSFATLRTVISDLDGALGRLSDVEDEHLENFSWG